MVRLVQSELDHRETLTATTQYFLDTCPAVKSWTPNADETTATFVYDELVEVPMVPNGVDFSGVEVK